MSRAFGNGDTHGKIVAQEQGPGYVVFTPENLLDVPEQFSAHLSLAFSRWLGDHPGIRVRATMPISDISGQTVILHVWFDAAD